MALSHADRQWRNNRYAAAAKARDLWKRMPKGTRQWVMAGRLYRSILRDIMDLNRKDNDGR